MSSPSQSQGLRAALAAYQKPIHGRSIFEVVVTVAPLLLCWSLALICVRQGWWAGLLLTIPAAAFLVRLFMIQHDCGHASLFGSRAANTWIGRIAGVLTATPYDYWRRTHAIHHATSSNLDRRTLGAVDTLTVEEYRSRSWIGRVAYRAYRNPIVLFGLGPAYMFVLQHRLPVGLMRDRAAWLSVMGANLGLVALCLIELAVAGPLGLLLVHLPMVVMAATVGVWLFYVQHQFEEAYWARNDDWSLQDAALRGSSYLKLPPVLSWMTANIGAHHVHHAGSKIPFYRLPQVMRDLPEVGAVEPLRFRDVLTAWKLALWDEAANRLVPFKMARAQ